MRDTQMSSLSYILVPYKIPFTIEDRIPYKPSINPAIHPNESFLIPDTFCYCLFTKKNPQLFLSLLDVAVLHHLCSLWWWRVARSPRKRSLPLVQKSWRRWGFLGLAVATLEWYALTPARLRPVPTGGNQSPPGVYMLIFPNLPTIFHSIGSGPTKNHENTASKYFLVLNCLEQFGSSFSQIVLSPPVIFHHILFQQTELPSPRKSDQFAYTNIHLFTICLRQLPFKKATKTSTKNHHQHRTVWPLTEVTDRWPYSLPQTWPGKAWKCHVGWKIQRSQVGYPKSGKSKRPPLCSG